MNEDTRLCIVHDSTLFGNIFSIARYGWNLFPGVFRHCLAVAKAISVAEAETRLS